MLSRFFIEIHFRFVVVTIRDKYKTRAPPLHHSRLFLTLRLLLDKKIRQKLEPKHAFINLAFKHNVNQDNRKFDPKQQQKAAQCQWESKSKQWKTCLLLTKCDMMSMGTGKTMVLLFSAEMLFKV